MKQGLYSLQGEFHFAKRQANGKPGISVWAGNVAEATLNLGVTAVDKKETFSGSRGLYGRMYSDKTATLSGVLDEWSIRNLALLLHSESIDEAGGSVTGEEFPDDLVDGDIIMLDQPYASGLVLTDSATPTAATVDTDRYEFAGHNQRAIRLLDVSGHVQPFSAAYTAASYDNIGFFKNVPEEIYLIFDGIDTESDQPVIIDCFRVQFDPVANLALLNPEYGSLPFNAALMYDPRNAADGGYARLLAKKSS
ncbi:MAG: hypothetical protein CGU29_01465 [Candidatus Dactylopiibacterium carminicum]|uniref:Uncharacterized protein n=1 Tax=Candidatus Dactylopiibacterium carminicum TaxID=857335 RepID=A0A272EYF8_9RHOO|nr:hypothetical protein [Candidatus Dactylopiibacterium carminicum]KAF7600624.1 hypothetical protein BGI27_01705 [Candidatus Dactylopiibacterium carminicum]PAS95141.1 MAG: hypothetical protein CGU29_01465 [Candidatus Dactylopiibacterium carminicum]PAT00622.1 MAG: hypothetical protein BSR46_01715 [Candidatus Dactylopiibacterium carminicum]